MRPTLTFLAFLPLVAAFDCSITAFSISYDISPLAGLRTASKDSSTPPTTSEVKVSMNLCGGEGLGKEDGVADEDQVGGMFMGNKNMLMIEWMAFVVSRKYKGLSQAYKPQAFIPRPRSGDGCGFILDSRYTRQ